MCRVGCCDFAFNASGRAEGWPGTNRTRPWFVFRFAATDPFHYLMVNLLCPVVDRWQLDLRRGEVSAKSEMPKCRSPFGIS
jgi:hypothetical protein